MPNYQDQLVSGGGLDFTNTRFVKPKDNFPVKVLSRKFRGKFLSKSHIYNKRYKYNNK